MRTVVVARVGQVRGRCAEETKDQPVWKQSHFAKASDAISIPSVLSVTKAAKESLGGSLRQNACPNSREERIRGEGWGLNRVRGDCVAVDPGQASTDASTFQKCNTSSVGVASSLYLPRLLRLLCFLS